MRIYCIYTYVNNISIIVICIHNPLLYIPTGGQNYDLLPFIHTVHTQNIIYYCTTY